MGVKFPLPSLQSLSVEERKSASDTGGGTETYMSPQRLESPGDTDTRDDIYSLGVILHHLLTGQFPRMSQATEQLRLQARSLSRGSDRAECLRKFRKSLLNDHHTQRLQPMSNFNPAVNAELDSIVAVCLAVERTDRYRSASELADDLLAWSERRPVKAHGRSVAYGMRKWCTRHPMVASMAAVLVALLFVFLVMTEIETRRQRRQAENAFDLAEGYAAQNDHALALGTLNTLIGQLQKKRSLRSELERARHQAAVLENAVRAVSSARIFRVQAREARDELSRQSADVSVPLALTAYDKALDGLHVFDALAWEQNPPFSLLDATEKRQLFTEVEDAIFQSLELQHRRNIRSNLALGVGCQLRSPTAAESLFVGRVAAIAGDEVHGLKQGDILLKINQQPASTLATIEQLKAGAPGTAAVLQIFRNKVREQPTPTIPFDASGAFPAEFEPARWVVVSHVPDDSVLKQHGIMKGDAIVAIDGKALDSMLPPGQKRTRDDSLIGCLLNLLASQNEHVMVSFLNSRDFSIREVSVSWTSEIREKAKQLHTQMLRKRIRQEFGGYEMAKRTSLSSMLKAYDIEDPSLPLREIIIRSYVRKGAWPEAIVGPAVDHVLRDFETYPQLKDALDLISNEKFKDAVQPLMRHLESRPTDPDALQLLMLLNMQDGNPMLVAEACTLAISRVPQSASYRLFRAEAYLALDVLDLALRDIDEALSLFPKNAEYGRLRQKILEAREKTAASPQKQASLWE